MNRYQDAYVFPSATANANGHSPPSASTPVAISKQPLYFPQIVEVREAGKVKQRQQQAKLKEIVGAICFIPMALFSENKLKFH